MSDLNADPFQVGSLPLELWPMLLYLIRHAESENNALWARTHSSDGRLPDPGLTEIGHQQAQLVAEHLALDGSDVELAEMPDRHNRQGYGLTHLYSSLMTRAVLTADYIARATGLPIEAWPEIHERGGLYTRDGATGERTGIEGPNRGYFELDFPRLILPDSLGETGWWNRPPETVDEAIPRAIGVWQQLRLRHGQSEDRVALVVHGGFFQSLMQTIQAVTGDPVVAPARPSPVYFGMSNTSISRFELHSTDVGARYLNRVDHLPSNLTTG